MRQPVSRHFRHNGIHTTRKNIFHYSPTNNEHYTLRHIPLRHILLRPSSCTGWFSRFAWLAWLQVARLECPLPFATHGCLFEKTRWNFPLSVWYVCVWWMCKRTMKVVFGETFVLCMFDIKWSNTETRFSDLCRYNKQVQCFTQAHTKDVLAICWKESIPLGFTDQYIYHLQSLKSNRWWAN